MTWLWPWLLGTRPLLCRVLCVCRIETDPRYDPKKDKGASLRLSGVTVGSGALLRREEELAALACVLPANPAVRKK